MQSTAHITSSNIDTIGHDGATLFIRFKSGASYAYNAVPEGVFTALARAESAGSFFHKFVKAKYQYTRLTEDPFISA